MVATEVAEVDWAEVAPADPVEAAVLASPPTQLVEEPAWMLTEADGIVVPDASVTAKVTPVPAAKLTVQVRVCAEVPDIKVARGVVPMLPAGKTRTV